MRKILPFFLFLVITIFAIPGSVFAETSSIQINEVYPAPLTEPDVEYIEVYVENPEDLPLQLTLCDSQWGLLTTDYNACKHFQFEKGHLQKNLLVLETGRNFLNNPGDAVYLIDKTDPDNPLLKDYLFYGNAIPPQKYSESLIHKKPASGQSISYIAEIEEYKLTSPTKGKENWLVELDFQILNSVNKVVTSVQKGEVIYIDSLSEIYGIPDYQVDDLDYLVNNQEINDPEIDTSLLEIGTNVLTLKFIDAELGIDDSISKELTILENLDGLIISEVFPNPEGVDETGVNEWVEILNTTNRVIQLQGLKLVRIGNSTNYSYTFSKDYLIAPGEYYLLYPSFALTNTEGFLQLQNNVGLINEFSYSTAVGEGTSVIRFESEIKITTTPTPKSKNIYTPTLEDLLEQNAGKSFTGLKFNTVLPNPDGSDEIGETEWIEVCNASNQEINLFGLVITQETSKISDFTILNNILIKTNQCLKIFVDFSINNTAAILKLQNLNEKTFDTVSYDVVTKENQVLVRDGDKLITYEEQILGESIEEILQITIQEAKLKSEDSLVKITGVVTAEPNLLGNDTYYIQDETGGVQILNESSPNLKIGDEVQVTGSMGSYHSEIRITSEAEDKLENKGPPNPKEIKIEDITPDLVGTLIAINGTVTKTSGNTIYVNDGTGEIKIYIKDSTGIERPPCRKGYYAKITGILSVWDTNDEGVLNYRLLPRYQEDVWISETLAGTGENILPMVLFGGLLLLFLLCIKTHDRHYRNSTSSLSFLCSL